MALKADDISVGDIVAISRGPMSRGRGFFSYGDEAVEAEHLNGVPLEVLAISLPFIAVRSLAPFSVSYFGRDANAGTKLTIDYRKVRLVRISQEFADAISPMRKGERGQDGRPQQSSKDRDRPTPKDVGAFSDSALSVIKQPGPNCSKCGGRDWEHSSKCPNNPRGRK